LPASRRPCLWTLSLRFHYTAPQTAHGHPDFQGIWTTAFLTLLERPEGVPNLIANPDEAEALVSTIRANAPKVVDPDLQLHDIRQLAMVKGQYRTSVIVEPEDGRMPLTRKGLELAARITRATHGSSTRTNGGRSPSAASRTSGTR
jgi:hypothetical protein